ncbi:DNA cytosine methyltransferase [Arthrobacter sp. HY1533]|uniref:DNA cytosine methyltransferase n=1 Tax=Arthrobacter sp. HY1533 TaxID=2970919 RepID=UPI0022B9FBB7|nr:DNA cytosine methyltransferase [Arthrobacter sp. HY1533]
MTHSPVVEWTDMFCGMGGSATGVEMVGGMHVQTAMNHWDFAIDLHQNNHPTTDHITADIKETDPRLVKHSTALWASPECTNHSVAKSKKRITNQQALFGEQLPDEAAARSRATMWDVVRYAEFHKYQIIITENVVDAAKWILFDSWLGAMDAIGYMHKVMYVNSMHAQALGDPAPQSRDRIYVLFWRKGNKAPDTDKYFRPRAYCPSCDEVVNAMQVFKKPGQPWGRYRAQYNWRCPKSSCKNRIVEPGWLAAETAIDWSIPGQRIGDRGKPLAEKTMARIEAGIQKFWDAPFSIDSVRGSQILTPVRTEPFPTQTTAYTRGLLIPVEGRDGKQAAPTTDPMRTQTTRNETGLLMEYYGNGVMHETVKPIPTITTHDRFAMITLRGHNAPKPVTEALDTIVAAGTHHGLMGMRDRPRVEDCTFRMLEPRELANGFAFPADYWMEGNKRSLVKAIGNSVTPPNARDAVACMAETLGVES